MFCACPEIRAGFSLDLKTPDRFLRHDVCLFSTAKWFFITAQNYIQSLQLAGLNSVKIKLFSANIL